MVGIVSTMKTPSLFHQLLFVRHLVLDSRVLNGRTNMNRSLIWTDQILVGTRGIMIEARYIVREAFIQQQQLNLASHVAGLPRRHSYDLSHAGIRRIGGTPQGMMEVKKEY